MRSLLPAVLSLSAASASAGYFELSANGSFYKYSNGVVAGEASTETTTRWGTGVAYRFMQNASIEFKYSKSKNTSKYAQVSQAESRLYRIERTSRNDNYSVGLNLDFADRKAAFRPFVSGGVGYMIRSENLAGTYEDTLLDEGETALKFTQPDELRSLSADAGLGFKIFVADAVAIEISGNVIATDLDKEEIYLHYSAAGGLRFLF
jgi:hypothetical protein